MTGDTKFKSTNVPPPGGKFFCVIGGEYVEARTWLDMQPKVSALMLKHGIKGFAEHVVADYMCPRISDWYCEGVRKGPAVVKMKEAAENAKPYFAKDLVTFDIISERMRVCSQCKMHSRDICLTCTGVPEFVHAGFGGRRPHMLEDQLSGTCRCARTYEMAIASVKYGTDESLWDDIPQNCWRNVR